jgi:hypothetical protein
VLCANDCILTGKKIQTSFLPSVVNALKEITKIKPPYPRGTFIADREESD